MKEKTLLKVSLMVSLVGMVLLYFLSSGIEAKVLPKVEEIPEETEVKISGIAGKVSETEKVVFLEVWNEKVEKVPVVVFKDSEVFVKEGDYVEITGTVEDYEGKKEVIANKVVKK